MTPLSSRIDGVADVSVNGSEDDLSWSGVEVVKDKIKTHKMLLIEKKQKM